METGIYSKIVSEDKSFIWHPFTQMQDALPPLVINRGKDSYLYTDDGRAILDGISSWWVNLHGHCHPHIVQKISQQLSRLEHVIFADFTHAPAVDLARSLLSILPTSIKKIFYSDNGSTSVEAAIKMAIQYYWNTNSYHRRKKVICFKESYHGDTFGAMSSAGKNFLNKPFWKYLFEVEQIEIPFLGLNEEKVLTTFKSLLESNECACFIFEPLILGVGGMKIYSSEILDTMIGMCKRYEIITIADEVMTGFGRTGTLFACDRLKNKPDIFCLSKGITGGFLPLGVTACSQFIFDAFLSEDKEKAFLHGHSYTGNPLACASGLASFDLLLDPLCEQQRIMIENCHKKFIDLIHLSPSIVRCEVLGTILVLEYRSKNKSFFDKKRDALYQYFINENILLRPLGNVLYVMPPYCIQENELSYIYEKILNTLET